MFPALNRDDILICGKKESKDINVGDIVVINSKFFINNNRDIWHLRGYEGLPVIHRVIQKEKKNGEWFFKTKGDNNFRIDGACTILDETNDYIEIEYDTSKALFIPESEIIAVALYKKTKPCPKCGFKKEFNLEGLEYEEIEYSGLFRRLMVKLYFNKNKRNKTENKIF